jgi:hypothetical protein
MTNLRPFTVALLPLSLALLACGALAPTAAPTAAPTQTALPATERGATPAHTPIAEPSVDPTPSPEPSAVPPSVTVTRFPVTPTPAPLHLEIVLTQAWTDYQGNARANVVLRNPYDFPVAPRGGHAVLRDAAGDLIRQDSLYYLDGISGGGGFLLPGERLAANACFNCEAALLDEAWAAVEFTTLVDDATDQWNYFTAVEAAITSVSFEGDRPVFFFTGTVVNNEDVALQRISLRLIVLDEAGQLVGAGEGSAWDVPAGAAASVDTYGIGQTPAGPYTYEVSALGVIYSP